MNSFPLMETFLASLLFYAPFDAGFDAVLSRGDGRAVLVEDRYPPSLTGNNGGKFGEAVLFSYDKLDLDTVWTKDTVCYNAKGNFPCYSDRMFDGAVGMWLMVDIDSLMDRDLIWLDPVHLLSNNRNESRDAGKIWMDFVTKELPGSPLFRFGATLPKEARENPDNSGEGHVITVPEITFSDGEWHHVIGTWKNLNTQNENACLTLYFDGVEVGEIRSFAHPLRWNIEDWEMRIGIAFAGKIDEFFVSEQYIDSATAKAVFASTRSLSEYLNKHK